MEENRQPENVQQDNIHIEQLPCGLLQANAYIVSDGGEAFIVDPGGSEKALLSLLESRALALRAILLTHGHFDHIGAVRALKAATGAPIYIHEDDAPMLTDARLNLSGVFAFPLTQVPADVLLHGEEELPLLGCAVRVLHTPGHSAGSVCFVLGDALFTGDTLFRGSVGRVDGPGANPRVYPYSLKRLWMLPGEYTLYPGHGESTTMREEKQLNWYFRQEAARV